MIPFFRRFEPTAYLSRPIISRIRHTGEALRAAQADLLRNERLVLLGLVAGNIGHELRNPLGVMSDAVYYLRTVLVDADLTIREYFDIIQDEIKPSERIAIDLMGAVMTSPRNLSLSNWLSWSVRFYASVTFLLASPLAWTFLKRFPASGSMSNRCDMRSRT